MSAEKIGFIPRMDGNYMIQCQCTNCGEGFAVHAMSNADYLFRAGIRLCGACRQVHEWMHPEPEPTPESKAKPSLLQRIGRMILGS